MPRDLGLHKQETIAENSEENDSQSEEMNRKVNTDPKNPSTNNEISANNENENIDVKELKTEDKPESSAVKDEPKAESEDSFFTAESLKEIDLSTSSDG